MIPLMAKRTTRPPTPPPATPASISPEEGIALLQELLERGASLIQQGPSRDEMDVYNTDLESALVEAFGSDSNRRYNTSSAGMSSVNHWEDHDPVASAREELRAKMPHITACIDQLKRVAARTKAATAPVESSQQAPSARGDMNMTEKSRQPTKGTVFIGHGGKSQAWRDLKDFLQDRLLLKPDEFNMEPAAGMTTKERLEEMLNSAVFAFLVMTGEDEYADKTTHARENVIHEVGLFQGALGFRRAIVVLEEGCAEFSNIQGLTQLRFPKGNIKAISEDIRRVLERERLLPGQ
jgi:predicted nucleotide-binding protein